MLNVITQGWKSSAPPVFSGRGSAGRASPGTRAGGDCSDSSIFSPFPIFLLAGTVKGRREAVSQGSGGLVLLGVPPGHALQLVFSLVPAETR